MSSVLKKLNILFCIIFVQSWQIISPASVYYSDYNSRDIFDIDANDYFDYNLPKSRIIEQKQYLNDANNNEIICTTEGGKADTATHATTRSPVTPPSTQKKPATTCFPVTAPSKEKYPTTTTRSSITPPSEPKQSTTSMPATAPGKAQADNIVEHILRTIKSMRAHATALITDMDILEKDLSGSSPTDLDAIKNASSDFVSRKIVYPDVLYQSPGYIINEWSVPVLKDTPQTNQFVEQAQEAVKSWKLQIENCKRILDNAVHNALQKANIKSDVIKDPLAKCTPKDNSSKLPAKKAENRKKNKKDLEEMAIREKHKHYGLYDALDTKFDDY